MGNCVAVEGGPTFPANKPTRTVYGDRKAVILDVTMSATYVAGGDNLDLSQWLKAAVDFVDVEPVTVAGTSYRPEYVRGTTAANGRLKVYSGVGAGNAEASGDLHLITFRVMAIGK
jgi:hypothetical protein